MKKKEPKLQQFPWATIAEDFIAGLPDEDGRFYYPTMVELSERYQCSYHRLRIVAQREKWVEKREERQHLLGINLRDRSIENFVQAAMHFDATCLEAAQKGVDHILAHFHHKEAESELVGQVDLDRLGRAFINYQRAGRLALGLTTENSGSRSVVEHIEPQKTIDVTLLNDKELEILEIIAKRIEDRKNSQGNGHVQMIDAPKTKMS